MATLYAQSFRTTVNFCTSKLLPALNGVNFVARGSARHYEIIKANSRVLGDCKLYLYQRQPIDIALEMIKNKANTITYITRDNYETVQAIPINPQSKQPQEPSGLQHKLLEFLRGHRFEIKKSFLDVHPYEAYHRICAYLQIAKKEETGKIYTYCHFSLKQIQNNTIILPFLNGLRNKYLETGQLKLKKLNRIRNATKEEVQQGLSYWKQVYNINQVYGSKVEEEHMKRKFALDHGLGDFVSLADILEGRGEKSFYASWQN